MVYAAPAAKVRDLRAKCLMLLDHLLVTLNLIVEAIIPLSALAPPPCFFLELTEATFLRLIGSDICTIRTVLGTWNFELCPRPLWRGWATFQILTWRCALRTLNFDV